MRTETEIREKYDEMLKHLELLMDKVRNPDKYDDVTIENIQEHINAENAQHSMNALMKWVLGGQKNIVYNVLQLYAVVCWLCAVGKLRIGAVRCLVLFKI